MFTAIWQAIFGSPLPPRRPFVDPVLGAMQPEEDWWTAAVRHGDDQFHFNIGGAEVPDESLIMHAREILQDFESFKREVRRCIDAETQSWSEHAKAEVAGLEIDCVVLLSPDHPNDGMIFFRTTVETDRLWRCDYVARVPKGLGFDD